MQKPPPAADAGTLQSETGLAVLHRLQYFGSSYLKYSLSGQIHPKGVCRVLDSVKTELNFNRGAIPRIPARLITPTGSNVRQGE